MKVLCCFAAVLSAIVAVAADIVPARGSQRIKPVFDQSDLVCNCVVESLTVVGERPLQGRLVRRKVRASVRIRDVYKVPDQTRPSIVVEFEHNWPGTTAAEPELHKGQTGLLFLKRNRSGTYEFTDRFLGMTSFRSLPVQSGKMGLQKLESALMGVVLQADKEESIRALQLLHGFDALQQSSVSSLMPLSNSRDPEIAFEAIAVLLRTNSPGALDRLNSYLGTYEGDSSPIVVAGIDADLSVIRALRSLPILEFLTDSRHEPIRFGAVQALRGIRARRSVPVLVRRLDDPNRTIQYLAVISLAEILGKYEGDYAPSMMLFDKDPRKYTDLWKKWWAEHKREPEPEL